MSTRPLPSRRLFLRGVVGGAVAALGLPLLEAQLGSTGAALADGGAFPKRFGLFFWGNGVPAGTFAPATTGAGYTMPEVLAPLEAVREHITFVTGTNVRVPNLEPHWSGMSGVLTGRPLLFKPSGDHTMPAATVDQVVAAAIGGETRFRSIEFGARPGDGLSFNGPDNPNPAESSPFRLWERVFGAEFREPGDTSEPDPRLALRRSILDSVTADAADFQRGLGAADRARIDQHLTGIRELELRLARLAENPANLAACRRADAPLEDYPDIDGRPQLAELNRAMCDTMALALACDQTRVFSNFITRPLNNLLIADATAGHHQLTHDEPGAQPMVRRIVTEMMEEFAYFVNALRAIPEGDGTLLDHLVLLGTTDISNCRTHAVDDFPILYAGTADGALVRGTHVRSIAGDNTSSVILSLIRAVGVLAPSFGGDDGYTEDGFSPIEA